MGPLGGTNRPHPEGATAAQGPALRGHAAKILSRPLSPQEWTACDRVALRLREALGALIATLPAQVQRASAMSRELGVVRNTCQRVVRAMSEPTATAEFLVHLPGVRGLSLLVDAIEGRGGKAADVVEARTAVEQYGRLIRSLAGSHAKLTKRITATNPHELELVPKHVRDRSRAARKQLCLAAAEILGRHSALDTRTSFLRLAPTDGEVLEHLTIMAQVGIVARQDALPLFIVNAPSGTRPSGASSPGPSPLSEPITRGQSQTLVLREFCTGDPPLITRRTEEGKILQLIDFESLHHGTPVDLALAFRAAMPYRNSETGRPELTGVWMLINSPVEHMIFDVFLHEDLERRIRTSVEAHLYRMPLEARPGDRWLTQLPGTLKLELLGRGLRNAGSGTYPKKVALMDRVLREVGWVADQFIGFRCEVEYPVWRGGYRIPFEYVE